MSFLIGMSIVFFSVFGGFVLSGGHLIALWQPFELIIIGGAAAGAFVISQPVKVIIDSVKAFIGLFLPNKYTKKFYLDLLCLFFNIGNKIRGSGLLSIEEDVEEPESSPLFTKYAHIIKDERLVTFIRDNMRIVISGNLSHYELEDILEKEIELINEEFEKPGNAVVNMSDGFPGFGIVAAVLGIVHTMSAIGGEAAELGKKVAAALVGTFLGVLLAYGVFGPIGNSMLNKAHKKIKVYFCMKSLILAFMAGTAPKLAVEYARKTLSSDVRPTFQELEEYLKKHGSK